MVRDKKTVRYPLVRDDAHILSDRLKYVFHNAGNLVLKNDDQADEDHEHLWRGGLKPIKSMLLTVSTVCLQFSK